MAAVSPGLRDRTGHTLEESGDHGRRRRPRPARPDRGAALTEGRAWRPAELTVGHRRCRGAGRGLGAADRRGLRRLAVHGGQGGAAADLRPAGRGAPRARRRRHCRGSLDLHAFRARPAVRGGSRPSTRTRVDLGLRFTDPPASARLLTTSPVGQCTQRVALTDVTEVDDEVRAFVRVPCTSRTAEACRHPPLRFGWLLLASLGNASGVAAVRSAVHWPDAPVETPGSRARAEPSRKA